VLGGKQTQRDNAVEGTDHWRQRFGETGGKVRK